MGVSVREINEVILIYFLSAHELNGIVQYWTVPFCMGVWKHVIKGGIILIKSKQQFKFFCLLAMSATFLITIKSLS